MTCTTLHDGFMKVTRFGHAAILVEVVEQRILIDPGVFSSDEAFALTGLSAIVVTHQHPDHIDTSRIDRLLAANPNAVCVADPQTATQLAGPWLENADGKETMLSEITLRGVGSIHAEITPQIPRVDNVGVLVIATSEPTLFHPGDTYQYAAEGVDVLALPLSAPWTKISETIDFVHRVRPTSLFPIHDCTISELAYGIYWNHTSNFGDVKDARRLGQSDSADFSV